MEEVHSLLWSLTALAIVEERGAHPLYTAARVGVFEPFWSQNGYRLCPFWSGIGEYGFRGNHGSVSRIYRLNSK